MKEEKFKVIQFIREFIIKTDKELDNFPKKDIKVSRYLIIRRGVELINYFKVACATFFVWDFENIKKNLRETLKICFHFYWALTNKKYFILTYQYNDNFSKKMI